jgi:hypothetical protein
VRRALRTILAWLAAVTAAVAAPAGARRGLLTLAKIVD